MEDEMLWEILSLGVEWSGVELSEDKMNGVTHPENLR